MLIIIPTKSETKEIPRLVLILEMTSRRVKNDRSYESGNKSNVSEFRAIPSIYVSLFFRGFINVG